MRVLHARSDSPIVERPARKVLLGANVIELSTQPPARAFAWPRLDVDLYRRLFYRRDPITSTRVRTE
jgi:hypothetical protein